MRILDKEGYHRIRTGSTYNTVFKSKKALTDKKSREIHREKSWFELGDFARYLISKTIPGQYFTDISNRIGLEEELKRTIFSFTRNFDSLTPYPRFVYVHEFSAHPPFTFDRHGQISSKWPGFNTILDGDLSLIHISEPTRPY